MDTRYTAGRDTCGLCHISGSAQGKTLHIPLPLADSPDFYLLSTQRVVLEAKCALLYFTGVFKTSEYKQYISVSHVRAITFVDLLEYEYKKSVCVRLRMCVCVCV